jgi:hypothetical protein
MPNRIRRPGVSTSSPVKVPRRGRYSRAGSRTAGRPWSRRRR